MVKKSVEVVGVGWRGGRGGGAVVEKSTVGKNYLVKSVGRFDSEGQKAVREFITSVEMGDDQCNGT